MNLYEIEELLSLLPPILEFVRRIDGHRCPAPTPDDTLLSLAPGATPQPDALNLGHLRKLAGLMRRSKSGHANSGSEKVGESEGSPVDTSPSGA